MKKSNNYSTDYISQGYYQRLVDLRMTCNKLLTELETETDPDVQKRFKQYLSLLAKELVPKYQRREDMQVPEVLEAEEDEGKKYDLELTGLDTNECDVVLQDFNDLMEKLGIVSKANSEYELETKGAVDKNA